MRSNRKKLRTENVKDDSVITHYASIHSSLKSERTVQKEELNCLIEGTDHAAKYGQPLSQEKIRESLICLIAARNTFKDRKMKNNPNTNGHNEGLDLTNRSGHTGKQFFKAFIERADKDHGVVQQQAAII